MGVQIQGGHTQIHQPPVPQRLNERRQFLSTLAPLTACVAGQRDDLSYYTLAHPGDRTSMASSQCTEYSLGDIDAVLHDDEVKKVAPDVIAGTPGQESDELAAFAQQEGPRTERLKKRYSAETSTSAPASGAGSDDDEQNDYGFNKRPSVRGIKPRFGSTNEILQQMQQQLAQTSPPQPKQQMQVQQTQQTTAQIQTVQSNTLPRPHTHTGGLVAAKHITAHHQHTASWSYYPDQSQQIQTKTGAAIANVAAVDAQGNYYQLPAAARHSYHGHEAIYQNCHSVQVQQPAPQYGHYARSPTKRPESPPPLRNYHQTMVLIPYTAEAYQQYSASDQEQLRRQQHNIVEYQQVQNCR